MDGKTFEDFTFEVISRISPKRVQRDSIPFDSVREIILSELKFGTARQVQSTENGKKGVFEEMDEITSTSSSSNLACTDEETTSGESRFVSTMSNTDLRYDGGFDAKNGRKDASTSSIIHHALSAPTLTSLENNFERKKPQTYRERRLAEMRMARIKSYRGNTEIVEFDCEENQLAEQFEDVYWRLINDVNVSIAGAYFCLLESLDSYFRARTWDSHCAKSCCEFLSASTFKTCQLLNEVHDEKDVSDEMRVRELMLQVLLGLHVFTVENEKRELLDDTINKLRMIYIAADPQKMRTFLEEAITDIFVDQIPESVAMIYEELCIALPADLAHFETRYKFVAEVDEVVSRRKNANAGRLEQMLAETSGEEKKDGRLKRRSASEKDLRSPSRRQQNERKRFYVEETPDEKYSKRNEDMELEEDDEVVQQTPMAKLRQAANKNRRRCSKRLSDLVKMSEERAEIPKRARENMEKMLEKAKTPLRSSKRVTKGILFANHSPSPMSVTRSSRTASLQTRLQSCSTKASTPIGMERKSKIRAQENLMNGRDSPRKLSNSSINDIRATPVKRETPIRTTTGGVKLRIKREISDDEYEKPSTSSTTPSSSKKEESALNGEYWSDRKLRTQLGLTRDDLNRYTRAMLAAGTKKNNVDVETNETGDEKNRRQVNRAGRVKKDGAAQMAIGGVRGRRTSAKRTFMCHVLLNESNPDMNFDWSKVNFEMLDEKPQTRGKNSYLAKPQKVLETLKRKYIESKSNPSSPVKRIKLENESPGKKTLTSSSRRCTMSKDNVLPVRMSPIKRESRPNYEDIEYDEFGFEREADD